MLRRFSLLISFSFVAFAIVGCGPKLYPTKCVVKMKGEPVAGATVTLIGADNRNYSGFSDMSGMVEFGDGTVNGVPAGSYKVLVTKKTPVVMSDGGKVDGKDYMEQMKKSMSKPAKGGPGPGPKGPGAEATKSELPVVYSGASTTPLSLSVPTASTPHPIDLEDAKK